MVEKGSRVKALVLDVSLSDNLVDLSLKQDFLSKVDEKGPVPLPSKKVGFSTGLLCWFSQCRGGFVYSSWYQISVKATHVYEL